MKINLPEVLTSLGIDFMLFEDGQVQTSIETTADDAHVFPLVLFFWTANNEREYLRLIISPFVERPKEGYPTELASTILMMNSQIPEAKFILDEEDLGFVVDIDTADLSKDNFPRALHVIGAYADYFYPEINNLLGTDLRPKS